METWIQRDSYSIPHTHPSVTDPGVGPSKIFLNRTIREKVSFLQVGNLKSCNSGDARDCIYYHIKESERMNE